MAKPKVTLGVILFKGEKYLPYSMSSLLAQDYPELKIRVRDQSPNGEAYEYLKKELPGLFEKARVEKGGNLWHSGGHNALIGEMLSHGGQGGEYYICASNDMLYPPDFVSRMITAMEQPENREYGSATCALLRWDFKKAQSGDMEGSKTRVLDSLGIGMTKGHRFFDIGQGREEKAFSFPPKKFLGPSGALGVFRKKTLEEMGGFDELLHYKNDVDLAYRMSWAGYPCLLVREVKVYHDRQVSEVKEKSEWARGNSLLGHLITLKKNYDPRFSLGVRLRTNLALALRYLHTLFLHPSLLSQYRLVKKFGAEIERKKKAMIKRTPPSEMEKLMI